MNKAEFIASFIEKLRMLPQSEVEKSLAFYTEMIDDRIEDGMDEQAAVSALGDINEIVKEVMLSAPLPTLVKAKIKPQHKLSTWEIVLLILGFPLWFPLLAAFFVIILSVYITVWSVIISLYAVVVSFGVAGIAGIIGSFIIFPQNFASGIFLLGGSAISIGLGILAFVGVKNLSVWLIKLTGRFLRAVKSLFIKSEAEGDRINETIG